MVDHAREDLLGYLLGALEESERESVEDRLEKSPELQKELARVQESLGPLWLLEGEDEPPPELAERTCELIASHPAPGASSDPAAAGKPVPTPSPRVQPMAEEAVGGGGHFARWVDVAVAAGIVAALFLLAFPAIHNSRFLARRFTCADHLRQIGLAMRQYSETHDGYYPPVYDEGRYAGAGIYAPILASYQLVDGSHWFVCPGSPLADDPDFRVPSLDELLGASFEELARLRAKMGGSYAFNLGFQENGHYQTPRNLDRPLYGVLADVPSETEHGRQSLNHGGRGQNVLHDDGSVGFYQSSRPHDRADDFFSNDLGQVAPGNHRNDAVLAPSDVLPVCNRLGIKP
jgi:hypothetical protein